MRIEEYRAKGAACFLAAKHSKSAEERMTWFSMADIWLKLAQMAERHTPMLSEENERRRRAS